MRESGARRRRSEGTIEQEPNRCPGKGAGPEPPSLGLESEMSNGRFTPEPRG